MHIQMMWTFWLVAWLNGFQTVLLLVSHFAASLENKCSELGREIASFMMCQTNQGLSLKVGTNILVKIMTFMFT